MKLKKYLIMVISLIILVAPFMLLAQNIENQIGPTKFKGDDIIGAPIIVKEANNANTQVGKVNDLIINTQGQVTHVVADTNKKIDMPWWNGNGLYLLPASAFEVASLDNKLALTMGQVTDPNIPRADSSDEIAGKIPANTVQLTNFKKFTAVGKDGIKLGKVKDLVVDFAPKTVTYTAIEESDSSKGDQNIYAFRFDEFTFSVNQQQINLGITKQQLESRPSFGDDNWPQDATF